MYHAKKTLVELLYDLEQEMLRLGYTNGSMQFYRRQWHKLLQFAKNQGDIYYSEQLGIAFVEKYYQILEKNINCTFLQSEVQKLRIIRMIGDFQLHNTILRRYYKHREILTAPNYIAISKRFQSYCVAKDYSKVTVDHYVKQSERFMDYLASQHILNCKKINLSLIHAYIKTLAGYTYKTVEQNICSMRAFFRFLLEINETKI